MKDQVGAPGIWQRGLEQVRGERRKRRKKRESRRKLRDPREMLSPGLAPSEPTPGFGGHVAPIPCNK